MKNNHKQQFLVVIAIWTDQDGVSHPDYQMIENVEKKPIETVRKEILDYAHNGHPDCFWSVNVYDADNMPPDTIPEGTTFTM